jgi:hypothetical protein
LENFSIRPDGEVGRMDDAAAFFPVRADPVRVFGNFQAVPDGELSAGFFDHLFGFVERIDGNRDDVRILLLEFLDMRLEVGYLPNAVGSPDAAIENYDGILAFDIRWNVKRAATSG